VLGEAYRLGDSIGCGVLGIGGDSPSTPGGYGVGAMGTSTRAALRLVPQISAPTVPQEGDVYYNGTSHALEFYNGTVWKVVQTV
jgi:hypothetical protein